MNEFELTRNSGFYFITLDFSLHNWLNSKVVNTERYYGKFSR